MAKGRSVKLVKKPNLLKLVFLLTQLALIRIGQVPLFIVYRSFLRGRGRPRKAWFLPYYLTKWQIFIKRRIPKKVKVAFAGGLFLAALFFYTQFIFLTAYQLPTPAKLSSR